MADAEIIGGVLLCLVALGCLVGAFTNGTVVLLGAAIIVGAFGGFILDQGWHGVNVMFRAKHEAIYRDLRQQGFAIASNRVYVDGPRTLNHTTGVELRAGACWFPFVTTKIDGTWRVTLQAVKDGEPMPITPAAVAAFAVACP